eukprot:CAMPEP_0174368366 /NCGR_PEP_ID=MMETSP0811_2-20130205/88801_1 /TAXON_ID=73025 ORGANISM="Eutreptiella gymnastica-like, Strain CCMP1594" /NCGR_SAMPLE_ID=MMETSP0811_2 /ASSEMBLY_ACC=CAM_ASM_000667 /LENGTH=220 /DNA_ID=CAMNT_0015511811 /DNA_START=51 /DNA_END=710 /DNA_ORIENTATION=+
MTKPRKPQDEFRKMWMGPPVDKTDGKRPTLCKLLLPRVRSIVAKQGIAFFHFPSPHRAAIKGGSGHDGQHERETREQGDCESEIKAWLEDTVCSGPQAQRSMDTRPRLLSIGWGRTKGLRGGQDMGLAKAAKDMAAAVVVQRTEGCHLADSMEGCDYRMELGTQSMGLLTPRMQATNTHSLKSMGHPSELRGWSRRVFRKGRPGTGGAGNGGMGWDGMGV